MYSDSKGIQKAKHMTAREEELGRENGNKLLRNAKAVDNIVLVLGIIVL